MLGAPARSSAERQRLHYTGAVCRWAPLSRNLSRVRRALRTSTVFDQLFESSVDLVLRGEHQCDEPPTDGGRWPVTIVCVPPSAIRDRLSGLMHEALVHASPGHFLTGRPDSSHLTVRALEPLDFTIDAATLVRSRHRRDGGEQYMAMEPWHSVSFRGDG